MALPYEITVNDVRPEDHGSFGTLPKLERGDIQKLMDFYKFDFDHTHGWERAKPGEKFWGIAEIELRSGPATLIPQVWDENGQLITHQGILMYLWYSGVESNMGDQVAAPPYHEKPIAGFTENGRIGWGYSGESHIGSGGGPFTVWASQDPPGGARIGSDAIIKVGWWDDHITPNPMFKVMTKPGSTPPPSGELRTLLQRNGETIAYQDWIKGPPPVDTDTLFEVLNVSGTEYHKRWITGEPA